MNTLLMPGTAEVDRLRLEIRTLQAAADWNALWARLKTLPPLLVIEAMQMFPVDWTPSGKESVLYPGMSRACRNAFLSDFEQLSRSNDETRCLVKEHTSKILRGSPDGRWIIQATEKELRIVDPETFAVKTQFEFSNLAGEPAPVQKIAVSPDSKTLALLTKPDYSLCMISIVSLETFQIVSTWSLIAFYYTPSIAFRSDKHLMIAGIKSKEEYKPPDPEQQIQKQMQQISECEKRLANGESSGWGDELSSLKQALQSYQKELPVWNKRMLLQKEAIRATGLVELDVSSGNYTSTSLADTRITQIALDRECKYIAFVEQSSERGGGCCPRDFFQIKVLQLSNGSIVHTFPITDADILNLFFVAGGYLIAEEAYNLTVFSPEGWGIVKKFEAPGTESMHDHRSRSYCTADGKALVFLEGRISNGIPRIRVVGFPELADLATYSLHSLCSKRSPGRSMETLTISGNRLIVETDREWDCTGLHSISLGLRNGPWDYATELRRISCTPVETISKEKTCELNNRIQDPWLTPQQRRWLNAVASTLELNQEQT